MSDSEDENPTLELKLPDYLPLKQELIRDFEKSFKNTTVTDIIKQQTRQIEETAEKYIKFILDHPQFEFDESTISQFIQSLENLMKSSFELSKLEQIRHSPEISSVAAREESDLTLESLNSYQNMTRPNFSDVIREKYLDFESPKLSQKYKDLESNHKYFKYLSDILFVIKNPEDPIPDDNEDEELNVSGGKISLKDPLSLNYYSDPVISKRCQHTFERSYIEEQFKRSDRERRPTHCPIAACSQEIKRSDLEPDILMVIRVRTFKKLETRAKDVDTIV
ncbi:E3 SUMO-protein ligase MMS21 [Spathaspora sp. JA1]|nr:E3 SUMO-protein ligase MMS21 [Spathaspora sp. JA1]